MFYKENVVINFKCMIMWLRVHLGQRILCSAIFTIFHTVFSRFVHACKLVDGSFFDSLEGLLVFVYYGCI